MLSTENDYIDFKRDWYSGPEATFDLFHDILSMCNSLTDKGNIKAGFNTFILFHNFI